MNNKLWRDQSQNTFKHDWHLLTKLGSGIFIEFTSCKLYWIDSVGRTLRIGLMLSLFSSWDSGVKDWPNEVNFTCKNFSYQNKKSFHYRIFFNYSNHSNPCTIETWAPGWVGFNCFLVCFCQKFSILHNYAPCLHMHTSAYFYFFKSTHFICVFSWKDYNL